MSLSENLAKLPEELPNFKTFDELCVQCLGHMSKNGFPFDGTLHADGKIYRFSIDHKRNQKDEWYIAFSGISTRRRLWLNCTYGSWSTGEKYSYYSWEKDSFLDQHEREEFRKMALEAKKNVENAIREEHERVANECCRIWEKAGEEKPQKEHLAYLEKKGIQNYGLRFGVNQQGYDSIIIKGQNAAGKIRTLQYISVASNGETFKSFHTGGEKRGNFFILGMIENGKSIGVAEGYATSASVHEAIGIPVIVAFDCGNLSPVVEKLSEAYPTYISRP